jgi:hypothetical protein
MRHQLTARISDADYRLLRALVAALQTSQADVVVRGLVALKGSLPPDLKTIVQRLIRQAAK